MLESNPSAGRKREGTKTRGGRNQNPTVHPSQSQNRWSSLPFLKLKNSPPINPMIAIMLTITASLILVSCASMAPVRATLGYQDAKSGLTYEITVRPSK